MVTSSSLIRALFRDERRRRLWRQGLRSRALGLLNRIRYDSPGPRQAGLFSAWHREHMTTSELHIMADARDGALPPPQPGRGLEEPAFQRARDIHYTTSFVGVLHNGRVAGKQGVVITPDGTVMTDVSPELSRPRDYSAFVLRGNQPTPQRFEGTLAVLSCGPFPNYFHWTLDGLARLQWLRHYDQQIDAYYVASDLGYQQELLTIHGIANERIIPAARAAHLRADRLMFTSLPGDDADLPYRGIKDPLTCAYMREAMMAAATDGAGERIFILRRGGRRTIRDVESLLKLAERWGKWRHLYLEELSVREQARAFAGARVIVAAHGAGLANLVYARPGTRVIEMLSPHYLNTIYYVIAEHCGLDYYPLIGSGERDDSRWSIGAEICIDPRTFQRTLEAAHAERLD